MTRTHGTRGPGPARIARGHLPRLSWLCILYFAVEQGKQDPVKERFLRGYLSEGEPIGNLETLVRLAGEAGLDEEQTRGNLMSNAYAREVRADENEARENGSSGVPYFVLGGRYAVSGAQPVDWLLRALERAWSEQSSPVAFEEGAACGPEGCD